MHERGVAEDLVRAAGVVAVDQGARRVSVVRIELGPASHLDPDSLATQVAWYARGTVVEGAAVVVEQRAVAPEAVPTHDDDRAVLRSVDVEM
jgi:Zn finger protein HypA/HybF involved in hydrogenase expression